MDRARRQGPKDRNESLFSKLNTPKIAVANQQKPITASCFSADGQFLAVARFGEIQVLASAAQKVVQVATTVTDSGEVE